MQAFAAPVRTRSRLARLPRIALIESIRMLFARAGFARENIQPCRKLSLGLFNDRYVFDF